MPDGVPTTICLPFADHDARCQDGPLIGMSLPQVNGPARGEDSLQASMSATTKPSGASSVTYGDVGAGLGRRSRRCEGRSDEKVW